MVMVEEAARGIDSARHRADVRREMGALKAMSDFVAQKTYDAAQSESLIASSRRPAIGAGHAPDRHGHPPAAGEREDFLLAVKSRSRACAAARRGARASSESRSSSARWTSACSPRATSWPRHRRDQEVGRALRLRASGIESATCGRPTQRLPPIARPPRRQRFKIAVRRSTRKHSLAGGPESDRRGGPDDPRSAAGIRATWRRPAVRRTGRRPGGTRGGAASCRRVGARDRKGSPPLTPRCVML
jgi:hypothetical protein